MADDGRFSGITFRNLDVSGFNEGAVVWSWEDDGDGFDDVLWEQLYLHENLQGGGSFYGAGIASHQDVVVRCSEFADNPGDPVVARPSGDGLVLGSVTNGLVDGCIAHHNGGDGTNNAGPVGLWAYNSSNVTIQFSESYANLAMYQDGDGFDLDVGTTNSVIQYCYSHDNFGAGYLLSQQGAEPWSNNVLRYNISENDAWGGRLGAITYYSEESDLGLEDSWVYGNTVYTSVGPALNLTSAPNASRNYLFNNIFVVDDGQMHITHIIRGEDHVSNTAVQMQIFEALGYSAPIFGHLALLKTKDGELSKRIGGNDIRGLRDAGILPMAINSLLAKMGTSDAVEPFADMAALAASFDFAKFGRAPANYDSADLEKLNEKLLHMLPFSAVQEQLTFADESFWNSVRGNLKNISEAKQWWDILHGNVSPDLNAEEKEFLRASTAHLPSAPWNETTYDAWLAAVKPTTSRKGKELFMPIRKALTSLEHGPELKKLLPLLGREKTVERLSA
jgi:hypothetical protein